jgi:alpha-beta hydrolase superfamily lysophospholipase
MIPAWVIEMTTPKKYLLNGLWFGPQKPRTAIIWIHGLSSSAFSKLSIVEKLVDPQTAVVTFNNRGSSTATRIRKINRRKPDGIEYVRAGGAHEKFEECVDDIEGALRYAKRQGARDIYLVGHSTGAQKSVYYATRKGNARKVNGIILLAPLSDYGEAVRAEPHVLEKRVRAARALVKKRKPHAFVPGSWPDAARFLSLYTPDSGEEIFTYAQPNNIPRTYRSLTTPLLVFFAGNDEYSGYRVQTLVEWFEKNARSNIKTIVIPRVAHSFKGAERTLVRHIRQWINGLAVLYPVR